MKQQREFNIRTTEEKLTKVLGQPTTIKLDSGMVRISFGDDTLSVWTDTIVDAHFTHLWSGCGNREYAERLFPKKVLG